MRKFIIFIATVLFAVIITGAAPLFAATEGVQCKEDVCDNLCCKGFVKAVVVEGHIIHTLDCPDIQALPHESFCFLFGLPEQPLKYYAKCPTCDFDGPGHSVSMSEGKCKAICCARYGYFTYYDLEKNRFALMKASCSTLKKRCPYKLGMVCKECLPLTDKQYNFLRCNDCFGMDI